MKYICSICGYVYDEAGNTPWAELPDDWKCPLCGASKADFVPEGAAAPAAEPVPAAHTGAEMKQLTAAETSALCSSLAKGCEKQYRPEQADAFRKLAAWFKAQGGGGTGDQPQRRREQGRADEKIQLSLASLQAPILLFS